MTRRKIAVIGTGGTISSMATDSLDSLNYPDFGTKLDVAAVLARTPETQIVAEPIAIPFRSIGSTAIGPADWLELRDLIHATAAAQPDIAGFVITHGTATLEETAFFLNLTLALPHPVVIVGAQRPASALGRDGGANLVAALRVAAAPAAVGLGVMVVMNDEIHPARDVVKTSTYRLQTFRSMDFGAIGHVDGDGVHFMRIPARNHAPDTIFASAESFDLPRVDIVLSYAGMDGAMVEAAIGAGARGIVSAGLAPGIPTPLELAALERAVAAGIVVVQCSRAASGRVGRRRYLQEAGIVAGEDFSPQKARILLMLALTKTSDPVEIGGIFASF
jgi:L-asparaginase